MKTKHNSRTAFTTRLAGCECCQHFTLLGLLHVIHQMDADPGFARLVRDLSMRSLAQHAAPVSSGCVQCAPRLHPVEWVEPLTNRELDVLHLMVERRSYREIAETLFISPLTVKTHVHNVFRKLGVNRRRFAIQRAHELGLVRAN
jgi:ATP/maltotriose-dependent transcriptional regulator MalT